MYIGACNYSPESSKCKNIRIVREKFFFEISGMEEILESGDALIAMTIMEMYTFEILDKAY